MQPKHLALAGAASLLVTGAAYAQLGSSATPNTGVTPNQPTSTPAQPGTTGIPSPDSTRVTGAEAGKTNLPAGQVSGGTGASTSVNTPGAYPSTGSSTTSAAGADTTGVASSTTIETTTTRTTTPAAGTYGSDASVTTSLTTNGPVPDTPENRRRYGGPMSRAGKHTAARGN